MPQEEGECGHHRQHGKGGDGPQAIVAFSLIFGQHIRFNAASVFGHLHANGGVPQVFRRHRPPVGERFQVHPLRDHPLSVVVLLGTQEGHLFLIFGLHAFQVCNGHTLADVEAAHNVVVLVQHPFQQGVLNV